MDGALQKYRILVQCRQWGMGDPTIVALTARTNKWMAESKATNKTKAAKVNTTSESNKATQGGATNDRMEGKKTYPDWK